MKDISITSIKMKSIMHSIREIFPTILVVGKYLSYTHTL